MADYEVEEPRDPRKVIAARFVAALIGLALVGFVLIPALRGGDEELATSSDADAASQDAGTTDTPKTSDTDSESTNTDPPTAGGSDKDTTDTSAVGTVAEPAATTPAPVVGVSYPTLPDGSPVPALVIYDDDEITLTGVVPTEAAKERLEFLVLANSKNPDATIFGSVRIDPTIPPNVGLRVIEMNSVRFPEGAARITPEHATELDRVVAVMNALPNTTALVVGHSDQRGTEEENYRISEDRALAAANHLVAAGISPMRVSARAVGESDLLTLDDDAAALALNRRTEFVIYGLLVE